MQVKRLLDVCSPRWRLLFTVALDAGLRRGELVGLRWGDVDLLQRIIYVRRSIGPYDKPALLAPGDARRLTTKTEAGEQLVPILDGAQAALEALYTSALDTSDHAPVFASIEPSRGADGRSLSGGRPLSPPMVTRVFRRYAERAALPPTVRLHHLRHTAITNAIGQGEDILLVSAFAGHAKTSTTVDVYGHLMPDRVTEAARRLRSVSGFRYGGEAAAQAPSPPASASLAYAREQGARRAATVAVRMERALSQPPPPEGPGGLLLTRHSPYRYEHRQTQRPPEADR